MIQDIEAFRTAQLKTLTKVNFQNCFRNSKDEGISVFEVRERILKGGS